MKKIPHTREFVVLNIAVLTVSDTRTDENDVSGRVLCECLKGGGHELVEKKIVLDDVYQVRAEASQWIADSDVNVVLITGGTGFAARDITPEAIKPLLDREIDGFGELFRSLSYHEIASSTIQSRAFAGLANRTLIFCLPGSTQACRMAWENILLQQLDGRYSPCNFVQIIFPVAQ